VAAPSSLPLQLCHEFFELPVVDRHDAFRLEQLAGGDVLVMAAQGVHRHPVQALALGVQAAVFFRMAREVSLVGAEDVAEVFDSRFPAHDAIDQNSSNAIWPGSTPSFSSILVQALIIIGGPQR